ncbi:hypothetical protein WDU94_001971 [Cyamophila willieti]
MRCKPFYHAEGSISSAELLSWGDRLSEFARGSSAFAHGWLDESMPKSNGKPQTEKCQSNGWHLKLYSTSCTLTGLALRGSSVGDRDVGRITYPFGVNAVTLGQLLRNGYRMEKTVNCTDVDILGGIAGIWKRLEFESNNVQLVEGKQEIYIAD